MKKLIFTLIILIPMLCSAQDSTTCYQYDPTAQPPDKNIDVYHMTARLKIDPKLEKIEAMVAFDFKTLRAQTDSIVFQTDELVFTFIQIAGKPATFKKSGNNTIIYPPTKLDFQKNYKIEFSYTTMPAKGIYFIGWNDTLNLKKKQVWAHRPYGWLPFVETRLAVDMYITFDNKYQVFSNGVRESVIDNSRNTKTWHFVMAKPHPFFSTAIVVGDYKFKVSKTSRGIPLELCYYPELEKTVETTYRYTEKMFDFFETELGTPYPWPLYREAPVVDYMYGAMETTTSTIYADFFQVDNRAFFGRNFINVNAHELVHQWFGNYLSHLTNKHVWITESFGQYYAKMFEKSVFGENYYQNIRNGEYNRTIQQSLKDNYPLAHDKGTAERWYFKGSLVLDMMRYVMGDTEFKTAIKYYLQKHANSVVESNDLLQSIRESTGIALDWFFDEWVYRGGEPAYKISYKQEVSLTGQTNTLFYVSQIQATNNLEGCFKMPIWFQVFYKDGTSDSAKVWVDKMNQEVRVPNKGNKEISFVLFDPGRVILKTVTFDRNINELTQQALNAPHILDRFDALVEMRKLDIAAKRESLLKIYDHESFHLLKAEIVAQLSKDEDKISKAVLKKAMYDKAPQVRNAVLTNITIVPAWLKKDYETLLKDSAYYIVEGALNNLCKTFPKNAKTYLETTKNETGWRGRNIRVKWLQLAIENGEKTYLPELIAYTGISYEFETRINAFNALKALDYLDNTVIKNLFDAALHWNFKLSNAGKNVLGQYLQNDLYKKQIVQLFGQMTWNENDKKLLSGVILK